LGIQRSILIFGDSDMLVALAAALRVSPLLHVAEYSDCDETASLAELHPNMILVDAAQVTPEQFRDLISICPIILSVDPVTHQLTVLASPHQADLDEVARVIEMISITLYQPA
jgi:hypothetical protein